MTRIDKKKICDYINSLLKDRCYVGLHSIVDSPTTEKQYSNLPRNEKAASILEHGLINSRGGSMNRTVRFFGDLSVATDNIKNKMSEYYEGINSMSAENYVAVVAIPYFFNGLNGSKIFGGYKGYDSQAQFNEDVECYTDQIFSHLVPSEMILGYYTYDDNEKTVAFVQNPRYYSNLSEEERLKFVVDTFGEDFDLLDINNPENVAKMERYFKEHSRVFQRGGLFGTMGQYISLKKAGLDHSHNPTKDSYSKESFELETISNVPIQLEYPDFSIHDVDCYRFAKAELSYRDYVYFIEYKDVLDDSGKEIACYAILENINGVFCKSDIKLDYDLLNKHAIRDIDLRTLPSMVTMKGSKRTEEVLIENYKRNEKHLWKQLGSEGSGGKIPPKQVQRVVEEQQLQDIYVVLPTIEGQNIIDFRKLASDFSWSGKFASFVRDEEVLESVPPHQESTYTSQCTTLSSFNINENDLQNIVKYMERYSKNADSINIGSIQAMISGNYRYNFIPASDNQYNIATNPTLKQIYLPSKKGYESTETIDMLQRYMNGTAFGMEKFVGTYGEHFTETRPQLRLMDMEKLNLIMQQNKLLRAREGYPHVEEIVPHVTDSYELDEAIEMLKKQHIELKKMQPLTPKQLEERKKKVIGAFSEFFSAMGVDVNGISDDLEHSQSKKAR